MARPKGHPLNRDAWEDWTEHHLGESLTQIADRSGIPRPSLSGIVGGFTRASVPMAHRLAAATGCRVGTLFPSLGASANQIEDVA